jgi:hypothetical protein
MDSNYIALKKVFEKNEWKFQESEDLFTCISVKNKNDMWLYNYNDNVLVDRNHPILIKCRGLVVNSSGKILNYPFERFFNYWEKEHSKIEWNTAEIQEKADGSLICVFWNGKDFEVTTRGSFYPNEKADVDFSKLFKERFDNFDLLDKNNCYMFELITKHNRIVKWYEDERIYLIGARNLVTFKEISQTELDDIAKYISVLRPKRYNADSFDKCKSLFESFKDDDEGLVVVDSNFNRVKVKQESYLKLSKIKILKKQDIFDYVLGKTQIDKEYLDKLPEVVNTMDFISTYWNKVKQEISAVFEKHKNKATRKDFALKIIKFPYKSVLFSMFDNKDINSLNLKWEVVKEWSPHSFTQIAKQFGFPMEDSLNA